MTLREYLLHLKELVKDHPQLLDGHVIYAHDEEGNDYSLVPYPPSCCFVADPDDYPLEVDLDASSEANAVCLN